MKKFIRRHHLLSIVGVVIVIAIGVVLFKIGTHTPPERITAIAEYGPVKQVVSVSGVADAKQSAELAFPVTGTVTSVAVAVGAEVQPGDILATLDSQSLQSDRQDALAALRSAQANRDELLSGPQEESRLVTTESVRLKEESLATIRETEKNKVENARRTLLSTGLTAYSDDASEEAVAPTISGTYTCDNEGTYTLDVFSSGTASGYSYKLSGLETGTFSASVDQAVALGSCGLRIVFDEDSTYSSTRWFIEIPNTKSSTYTASKNAYDLAVTQAASAISLAERDLALAKATAGSNNAPARSETIVRAQSSITQAEAQISRIDAALADRVLRAPFSGTITEINITAGETVGSEPIMTLLSSGDFEIKARIPEIDIGRLSIGQRVEMLFDAKSDTTVRGAITFISLKSTEIEGVSYYEAYIKPDTAESWIRSGLNADIDIILKEETQSLRIPKRFVQYEGSGASVLKQAGDTISSVPVTVILEGTDGYVAITGLNAGDVVVAP